MDISWIFSRYILDTKWIQIGYILDTLWINIRGYFLDISAIHFGYKLPEIGYILDTTVINIRGYKMDIVTLVNTAPNGIIREFLFCISAKFSAAQMVNAYT